MVSIFLVAQSSFQQSSEEDHCSIDEEGKKKGLQTKISEMKMKGKILGI